MKKALISLLTVGVVAVVAVVATSAFFNDTETSTGNILQAGALDLKVDSTAHYAGMVCALNEQQVYVWTDEDDNPNNNPRTELLGLPCVGTWPESDLDETHRFFDLTDVKPGDEGENTLSLHVYNNDAWLRMVLNNVFDLDNSCPEPELEAEPGCTPEGEGELDEVLAFQVWLDQGSVDGFQNNGEGEDDPGEGDNIRQENEPLVDADGLLTEGGLVFDIWPILAGFYTSEGCTVVDGHTNYGLCHGLAADGRAVGSTTYYFGVGWSIPSDTGNEIQTDSLESDIIFEAEQHRNNPVPFGPEV